MKRAILACALVLCGCMTQQEMAMLESQCEASAGGKNNPAYQSCMEEKQTMAFLCDDCAFNVSRSQSASVKTILSECEAKRESKHIKSRVGVIKCAEPRIKTIYAGDQNSDLVRVWLAKMKVLAEKRDRGQITEGEADLELATLESELTGAAKDRRQTQRREEMNERYQQQMLYNQMYSRPSPSVTCTTMNMGGGMASTTCQ